MGSESEEGVLLGVTEREGFEATEYDRVVCNHDGVLVLYGFFCHSFCKVDCEEDGVAVASFGQEGSFEKKACVVEGSVGKSFRIEIAHGSNHGLCKW